METVNIPQYSFSQFEQDLQNFKPRSFDTYILPAFMMYFAYKAKSMPRVARRMLFVAGIYMGYRSYNDYKNLYQSLTAQFAPKSESVV